MDDFQDASFGIRPSSLEKKTDKNHAPKSTSKNRLRKSSRLKTELRSKASCLIEEVDLYVEEAELETEKSSGSLLEEQEITPPEKRKSEIDEKEPRLFMGGPKRNKWPPSAPIFNDCDRRTNIERAREHPDFNKTFKEIV